MDITKMTVGERLAIIRKELFDGVDLDDVNYITESDKRQLMLMHAERILGMKPKGEAAKHYVSKIYGKVLDPWDTRSSFLYNPQEGVEGWLSDLMNLLAYLLDYNPWNHPFSLRWLSAHFDGANGDDPYQFSPNNKQLMLWLEKTEDRRIAALVGKKVQAVAEMEMEKISVAYYDYIWDKLNDINPDYSNVAECNDYVNRLLDTIDKVDEHIDKGRKLALSIEEIGLVDSMFADIRHSYPSTYVAATKEIWLKIKNVRDNFADGRKTQDDCDLFTNDMVKIALPIAEKYDIDMELDDEHSLPLDYLKSWLFEIYYGDDPKFN